MACDGFARMGADRAGRPSIAMKRRALFIGAVVTAALLAAAGSLTEALAQASSVGGVAGKIDKAVSGEGATGSDAKPVDSRNNRQRTGLAKRQSSTSVGGKGKPKVFVNPRIDGSPVDRCLSYATECGEPAATAWCRRKGMARATGWKYESAARMGRVVGALGGAPRDCKFGCDGFTEVVCE
jgi:hypothetical protein